MPWKPAFRGERPTLGFYVLDWIIGNLAAPDREFYEPFVPTQEQADFILAFYELDPRTGRRIRKRGVLSRSRGWGKALALDTPVPTPGGWSTMGTLAIGDTVFSETGESCRVVGTSPVWVGTDCYRVTFSDGGRFIASGDHRWTVEQIYGRCESATVDTRSLASHYKDPSGRALYRIPSPAPLRLPSADLPIDPYVLGVWLGDGNSDDGRITSADVEVVDEVRRLGYRVEPRGRYRWQVFGLKVQLRALGVLHHKRVPDAYARASRDQRLALLQGLMDTDGSIYDNGVCEFATCSRELLSGVSDVLASLGVKFAVYTGPAKLRGRVVGERHRIKFTVHDDLPVFRLPRKLTRMRPARASRRLFASRRIVEVARVPSVPTRCIEVDSPSRLFLAGDRMTPTHNSPFLSSLAIAEGLADVVPDGWDADGRPVGKPWTRVRTPLVQIAAASEEQTRNSWSSLLEMLIEEAPVFDNFSGLEPLGTFVNLPRGRIEPVTTSSTALKGKRPVFVIADQTEQWNPTNGATKVYDVIVNNVYKGGGSIVESPNAFIPGEDSQAERTAKAARDIIEGRNRKLKTGMLYDHREAPAETDLADDASLTIGLRIAYGDSSGHPDGCVLHDPPCAPGWVDLEGIKERIWQTDANEQQSKSDWLNQITHASDAYLSEPEWKGCHGSGVAPLVRGQAITLGFDGSRGRARGKPDATALIGCRVSDGHLFTLGVWEAGDDPAARSEWPTWSPPIGLIEGELERAFKTYRVVGFYADPARDWRSHVNAWEAKYASRMPADAVKARRDHPFEWWMSGGRSILVELAVEGFYGAVVNRDLSHDGNPDLWRHALNARRRIVHRRLALGKENDYSPRKIDAVVAAVLAWQARLDAVAAGHGIERKPVVPRRLY